MHYTKYKKISGGKSVKIDLEIIDGKIVKFILSGDFFAFPNEKLEEMEKKIIGKSIDEAEKIINKYKYKINLIGISFNDILSLLNEIPIS
ncbi:MAG: hypothetical protein DRJ45_02740 [Thermoprotei archaeon]|nr:MAG: hypothetical protein DRJ45_02740 [Thermoprotei archaeon]